jgi:hypothetical protein
VNTTEQDTTGMSHLKIHIMHSSHRAECIMSICLSVSQSAYFIHKTITFPLNLISGLRQNPVSNLPFNFLKIYIITSLYIWLHCLSSYYLQICLQNPFMHSYSAFCVPHVPPIASSFI